MGFFSGPFLFDPCKAMLRLGRTPSLFADAASGIKDRADCAPKEPLLNGREHGGTRAVNSVNRETCGIPICSSPLRPGTLGPTKAQLGPPNRVWQPT